MMGVVYCVVTISKDQKSEDVDFLSQLSRKYEDNCKLEESEATNQKKSEKLEID